MAATVAAWGVRFSPKTALAIDGAVALASRRRRRQIAGARVAKEVGAAEAKMCRVLDDLKRAGLLTSDGNGSVAWGDRRPSDVSLYDIAVAVGEKFRVHCRLKDTSGGVDVCRQCPMKCFSTPLRSEVVGLFKGRRLSDLMLTGS